MKVREATEEANIPYTYVSANCFAGYFAGNLAQLGILSPPRDKVAIYGHGNKEVIILDERDITMYTIKMIDDPRTLNKTLYLRPPENILTQIQLVEKWEKLVGKKMEKFHISAKNFLASMEGLDFNSQVGIGHFYHIFYKSRCSNFEIGEDREEASELYSEVRYTRMEQYLKCYL